jgi:hypothetical protein
MKKVSLAQGVVVEDIAGDVLVMVPGSADVMRLTGGAADVVRTVLSGDVVVPNDTVSELIDRGVLTSRGGVSRRSVVTAGAVGAGAGIAVLSMPGVAAASSGPSGGGSGDASTRIAVSGFYAWEIADEGPAGDDWHWYLFFVAPKGSVDKTQDPFDFPDVGTPSSLTFSGGNISSETAGMFAHKGTDFDGEGASDSVLWVWDPDLPVATNDPDDKANETALLAERDGINDRFKIGTGIALTGNFDWLPESYTVTFDYTE